MSITFVVDRVRASSGLPRSTELSAAVNALHKDVLACSNPDLTVFDARGKIGAAHALVVAAHQAFAEHYRLSLSADVFWVTIAQGVARHISLDPEKYRHLFVDYEGVKDLLIISDSLPGSESLPWDKVIDRFAEMVGGVVGAETSDLFLCDFSTTGAIERTVSRAVLLDAMQSYCSYSGATMCGIPKVTLEGTPEDWVKLHEKVQKLTRIEGLDFWLPALLEITGQLVAAAAGNHDPDFWSDLVKVDGMSGGPYINGWIMHLFPYLRGEDNGHVVNRLLAERRSWNGRARSAEGLTYREVPVGLAAVPIKWKTGADELKYRVLAGAVAVEVIDCDTLRPALGWVVQKVQ